MKFKISSDFKFFFWYTLVVSPILAAMPWMSGPYLVDVFGIYVCAWFVFLCLHFTLGKMRR